MTKKKEPAFETQLAQLEEIVRELDAEELPLEKAIQAYEKGVKLSLALNKTLEDAQRKIEMLTQTAHGQYATQPVEEEQE